MNCEEFETIVNDLARAELMNADVRAPHLAHAKTCDSCASRLANKRTLAAGLRAVAADVLENSGAVTVLTQQVQALHERYLALAGAARPA